jgi:ABC-type multidrug transport system fused ATPase/permease subunit
MKNKATAKKVLRLIKPYRMLIFASIFCSLVSVCAQLIIPYFSGNAIDFMLGAGSVSFEDILRIIGIIAIIGLVYFILYLMRRFNSTFDDRGDLVENLQEDDLEAVHLTKPKSDTPGIFDRSPNATIRRRYRKTILRASKIRPSAWMTPTEAEENADLTGQIDTLHNLYIKARYSPEGCTKQDVAEL